MSQRDLSVAKVADVSPKEVVISESGKAKPLFFPLHATLGRSLHDWELVTSHNRNPHAVFAQRSECKASLLL